MTEEREPIYWRGELIGYIEAPNKYPVLWRGKWVPKEGEFTERFLSTLRSGHTIWVEYGTNAPKDMAQVKKSPTEEIELYLDIEEEQTIFINPFKDNPDLQ